MVIAAHSPGSSPQAPRAEAATASSASRLSAARLEDDLRAFANLTESLQHLGPDRLLRGTARARDRDLQLIWLFLCCVVGLEAGDHAVGYEALRATFIRPRLELLPWGT